MQRSDDTSDRTMARVRIGAVVYTNAKPLVRCLGEFVPEAEVVCDVPSRLADGIAAGSLDVALIPSIEHFRIGGTTIVSDACIACEGPVRSVRLFSRVRLDAIQSLALDEGSRTSAAMVRIMLTERFGVSPRLHPLPIGVGADHAAADAVLLIGDRGIQPPSGRFPRMWDLGEEWTRWTGLPFVFAMWVARPHVDLDDLDRRLAEARDRGTTQLVAIAREDAPLLGISQAECLEWLRDHLVFRLGPRQRLGLERFRELAVAHGLAPEGAAMQFHVPPAGLAVGGSAAMAKDAP
jgi:chorismate dehydratase